MAWVRPRGIGEEGCCFCVDPKHHSFPETCRFPVDLTPKPGPEQDGGRPVPTSMILCVKEASVSPVRARKQCSVPSSQGHIPLALHVLETAPQPGPPPQVLTQGQRYLLRRRNGGVEKNPGRPEFESWSCQRQTYSASPSIEWG